MFLNSLLTTYDQLTVSDLLPQKASSLNYIPLWLPSGRNWGSYWE